jgi:hypothetical protein
VSRPTSVGSVPDIPCSSKPLHKEAPATPQAKPSIVFVTDYPSIYALLPPLCRGCNTLWVDLLIKSTLTDAAPLQQSPVFLVNFSFLLRYSFQHRNRKALERGVLRCAQITKSLIFIFEILRFLNPPLVD